MLDQELVIRDKRGCRIVPATGKRTYDWLNGMAPSRMQAARLWGSGVFYEKPRHSQQLITSGRVYHAIEQLREYVDIDPEKRGGVPVIRGTRFKVSQLFSQLAEGDSVDDLVDELDLNGDTVRNLLYALSVVVDQPQAHERNSAR